MREAAMNIEIKQLRENIHSVVANLKALGDVEDGRAELAAVRAQIDVAKRDLAGIKTEFAEVKRAHDDILRKAHEKQAELEGLEREIKKKSEEQANLNNWLSKIRQQLGG
jgi:chromosome segregation ATPase